jgi:hypothetical protein
MGIDYYTAIIVGCEASEIIDIEEIAEVKEEITYNPHNGNKIVTPITLTSYKFSFKFGGELKEFDCWYEVSCFINKNTPYEIIEWDNYGDNDYEDQYIGLRWSISPGDYEGFSHEHLKELCDSMKQDIKEGFGLEIEAELHIISTAC